MMSLTAITRSEDLLVPVTVFYRVQRYAPGVGQGVTENRRGPAVRSRTWCARVTS